MTAASLLLALLLTGCGASSTEVGAGTPDVPGTPAPPPPSDVPVDVPVGNLVAVPGTAPGTVELRFTAPGESGQAAADAYVVRSSIRHISEATLSSARTHTTSVTPSAPGTAERIVVTGLEPGRTLQFAVQARRNGVLDPVGYGVGCRVTGTDLPTPPPGTISLDGPATLSKDGATYRLTRDVTASGTAFRITGAGVTLDLGGHLVTYGTGGGTAYGVIAEYPRPGGTTTVRNGLLVQGSATGARAHGIFVRGVDAARVSYVAVTVRGPDANGIWVTEADAARVDHCAVDCRTTVVTDRHYPGVTAIFLEDVTGPCEVDQNAVTSSPQWGIRVQGRTSSGDVLVHHNRVTGTKALVANGYMLAVHKPDADVYENVLSGESRGIHIDGIDGFGNGAWIHDNGISFQDQTNAEYPDRHWAHGIKVEGASDCVIERNHVRGTADSRHADVYALDVTLGQATGLLVRHNAFEAVSSTPELEGRALNWTYGASRSPADALICDNVFTATDVLVYHDWDGGAGGLHQANWWIRDLTLGAAHPFVFEHFLTGDRITSRGFRFLDPVGDVDLLAVTQWADAGTYESTREWTLEVRVTNGSTPTAGASVAVRDRSGNLLVTTTTDADGRASATVPGATITRGPTLTVHFPHRITVSPAGGGAGGVVTTWNGPGRAALHVDLAAASATFDTTPPGAVPEVDGHALSASRGLLRWDAAEDDTGVFAYLVYLGGRPVGITEGTAFVAAGLEPGTGYVPGVRAVDAALHVGPLRTGPSFQTPSEDRGP